MYLILLKIQTKMRLKLNLNTGLITTNLYKILFSLITFVSMSASRNITLTKQPLVVVIGAGASGIAAATELVRYGFKNVKVLEAENRIGGRVWSQQLFRETLVDLGAEFYEGLKEDAVWEMMKPYQKQFLNETSDVFKLYHSHGEMVDENLKMDLFEHLNQFQEDEECDNVRSVGECFHKKYEALINSTTDPTYADFLKRSKMWSRAMLHLFSMASDLYDWGLGTHPTKGPLWSWQRRGYSIVIDLMLGRFPDAKKNILSTDQLLIKKEVSKIEDWREESKVKVKCSDNTVYEADHVICTMSIGVLKATQDKMFEPVLPEEKVEAIQKTGFGPLCKVILRFKENVNLTGSMSVIWEPEEFNELIKDKDLHWLQWLSFMIRAENNAKVLICFYSGMGVHIIESLPDDVIMAGHRYLTHKVLKPRLRLDFPLHFVRTTWSSNPHFRGVNSYKTIWGDFQKQLEAPLPSEDHPRILFAGEATHPKYYTTVHGAVETGLREAWRLIDLYTNHTKPPLF